MPCVVDLAAMRDAMADLGGDPAKINPLVPVELVIDHSVQVDVFGTRDAFRINAEKEFERNEERYAFLRWGQTRVRGLQGRPAGHRHRPPGQPRVPRARRVRERRAIAVPRHAGRDRLAHDDDQRPRRARLGRRRHRGRGRDARPADVDADPARRRLQAAAASCPRARPRPTSCSPSPRCCASTASSASSSSSTAPASRTCRSPTARRSATCRPEFGSTCAIFPIDAETLRYLEFSGRPKERIELVEAYAREQGLWHDEDSEEPTYSETLELDLGEVVPSLAGPKRPQDRVSLTESKASFRMALEDFLPGRRDERRPTRTSRGVLPGLRPARHNGDAPRTTARPSAPGAGTGGAQVADRDSTRRPGHAGRRHGDRARPRPRRDRRDHVVHEHLEPVGDDRRRPAGPQRGRARA